MISLFWDAALRAASRSSQIFTSLGMRNRTREATSSFLSPQFAIVVFSYVRENKLSAICENTMWTPRI